MAKNEVETKTGRFLDEWMDWGLFVCVGVRAGKGRVEGQSLCARLFMMEDGPVVKKTVRISDRDGNVRSDGCY